MVWVYADMMDAYSNGTEKGQAIYSPLVLGLYDLWVLGLSNHLLWRCPTVQLRDLYHRNASARHLDIGAGTGYYLDRAKWPVERPEITLLDLNDNSLAHASRRIARYAPIPVKADALLPFPLSTGYQSVGLCFLLHCLPGAMSEKCVVFDHVKAVLAPGGRMFGATIVQGDAPRGLAAQRLLDLYNARGIFSNARDTLEDLTTEVARRFPENRVEQHGCVAIFEATTSSD